jgi:GAF domain-containing protein
MDRDKTYLKLLLEVILAITSNLQTKEVFELIAGRLPEVFGVDAITIRLLDSSGKRLILHAASGLSDSYLGRGPLDAEESVMKALAGTPIAVYDASNDPRINYPEEAKLEGIQSILVVPITVRGSINGVLRLLTKIPRKFDPQEIEFASALADQCGIAIDNARTYEAQQRQLNYFKALYAIGKAVNATHELDQILDLIVKRLPEVMNLKACTIRLREPDKQGLELKAAYGLSQSYLDRGPLDDELATYYIMKGEPVLIPDATVDIHTIYHKEAASEGIGSVLAVPIIIAEETIGMLRLLTSEVRYFSDADINFAMTVGEQCGVAIQRAIEFGKLEASHSPLA